MIHEYESVDPLMMLCSDGIKPGSKTAIVDLTWVREQIILARQQLGQADLDGCMDTLERLENFADGP